MEARVARALAKSPADRFPTARRCAPRSAPRAGRRPGAREGMPVIGTRRTHVTASAATYRRASMPPAPPRMRAGVVGALVAAPRSTPSALAAAATPRPRRGGVARRRPVHRRRRRLLAAAVGEGVVDALSFNLNDVGALRAVQPSVADAYYGRSALDASLPRASRGALGRASPSTARSRAGRGSVRLAASLLDVDPDSARHAARVPWTPPPPSWRPSPTRSRDRCVLAAVGEQGGSRGRGRGSARSPPTRR